MTTAERDKCSACLGTGLEVVQTTTGSAFWPCCECRGRGWQKPVDSTTDIGELSE